MKTNSNFSGSIESLHPHKALALANQWVKLKNAHPADIRKTYKLRDGKIADWINERSVIMSKVICRQSETIESMKTAILSDETLLEHLNYNRWQKDKKSKEVKYWKLIESIAYEEGDGVLVPLPEAEQFRLSKQYEKDLRFHKEAKKRIRAKSQQIDRADNISNPISSERIPPKPIKPELFVVMSLEECLELTSPEIITALHWTRSILKQPDLLISDINPDLLSELEEAVIAKDLEALTNKAYVIFDQTINGQLTPREVYEKLTALNLNYSDAFSMGYRQDRYGNNHHLDFGAWHEINFSPTGLWLIEYQSVGFPDIVWYSRYDRLTKSLVSNLPQTEIDREELVEKMSIQKQQAYPIAKLLKVLNISPDDFPHRLKKYSPKFSFYDIDCGWDYREEWELAGY